MSRRPTLSGLVAKGYKPHKHNWQRIERLKYGVTFKFFVCTEHPEPVLRAYDMEVMTREQFLGASEYQGRR